MTHPNREEWMSFLYREVDARRSAELREHLQACPECADAVGSWCDTMKDLRSWPDPKLRKTSVNAFVPAALKWGIAAVFLIGTGVGLGRWVTPMPPSVEELRTVLVPTLRSQLRADFQEDLRAALASQRPTDPFQREIRTIFATWQEEESAVRRAEFREALALLAETIDSGRREDRVTTLALVQRLRRDLETVAVVADAQFQETENQLGLLASYDFNAKSLNLEPAQP